VTCADTSIFVTIYESGKRSKDSGTSVDVEVVCACCSTPQGLEDVSKYPQLLAALLEDPSWREEDLKKLAGLNLLRVFRTVEEVRPG
jgi:microsomal dipeptidase-like Zn-dependent dipeptidase